MFSQDIKRKNCIYGHRRHFDGIGQILGGKKGILHSFCIQHTKLHIVKQLYLFWLGLCFSDTLKADRQEPHLLLTGFAEKHLLATGVSHGTIHISPQLCCFNEKFSETVFASVEMISYASINIFNSSIYYRR